MQYDYFRTLRDYIDYKAGDVIFEEGMRGETMYVVRDGLVHIMHNEQVLETCDVGDFFGEMALLDEEKRAASAVAKTDCEVFEVTRERFEKMVADQPSFALQVMSKMADRIRHITQVLSDLEDHDD